MDSILELSDLIAIYKKPAQAPIEDFSKWFPLFPSEKLAELCGFLIGDGHLQPAPRWRVDFTSNSFETLNYVNSLFFDLFGIKGKIRKCVTNNYDTYNLGVNCKSLTRTLFLCGVPTGAKVQCSFGVPNWVLADAIYFRAFLRAYFSSEGCVEKERRISVNQWKCIDKLPDGEEFMSQVIFGLKNYFGISCSGPYQIAFQNNTKKGITQAIKICIRRKKDFEEYTKKIGFVDLVKQAKAELLVGDY
ncbi:MAG: LAGLIDADG family homing endonuclease [archaeon]|jgi:hypothetical protein